MMIVPWEKKICEIGIKVHNIDQENTHVYSICNVGNFRSGVNMLKFCYESPVSTLKQKQKRVYSIPIFMNGILKVSIAIQNLIIEYTTCFNLQLLSNHK